MNIAILHCKKAADVCAGASCFKAYNNNTGAFAEYEEKPELCAFFHCGGCDIDWENDSGMTKKMERLHNEGVERVHIGVCVGMEGCERKDTIIDMLKRYEMEVVLGTH